MSIKSLIRGKKNALTDKKPVSTNGKTTELAADAVIDFPKEGEEILAGHYAVRISAKTGLDVEIGAGGNEWWPCRESVGFFWFDWWPSKVGRTTLALRVKSGKGKWKKVSERTCKVSPGAAS